jgi:glycosyltransferase involved in cell wall biosynthesis
VPPDAAAVDAVVLLASRWPQLEGHRTRWREVVRAWAGREDVRSLTVVDYPDEFRRRALLRRTDALVSEVPSWLPGVVELGVVLPVRPESTALDALGYRRLALALERRLPRTGPRLVVAAWPGWVPLVRRLGASYRGFDAVDDWRAHPEMRSQQQRMAHCYRRARGLRTSTVSAGLADTLARDFGLMSTVVQNGVDVGAHARSAQGVSVALPTGPFAVYVGTIQERLDLALIRAVADLLAGQVPLVLVGPVDESVRAGLAHPGIHVTGPVPADEVPAVLARSSAGLLPHRDDALTRSMDPMKLAEYLAVGLRVVSTPVALPDDLAQHVTTAEGAEEFAAAVKHAVAAGRQAPVVRADWDEVADDLFRLYTSERVARPRIGPWP